MAQPLPKPKTGYNYYNETYPTHVRPAITRPYPASRPKAPRIKRRKRVSIAALLCQTILAAFIIAFITPFYMDKITRPLILRAPKYPAVKVNYNLMYAPTVNYMNDTRLLGVNLLGGIETKNPEMQPVYETYSLPMLENKLKAIAAAYPSISPSIYVWDYESGKFANIDADRITPAASIIKIPVLVQLFKSIESGQIKLYDKMKMTGYYKSEGSGSLQFKDSRAQYSIDELARVMITESDNSATNMLMTATGGMVDVNNGLRRWGLSNTKMNDWLPNLKGSNVTTAKEMARILYNLDNPNFLSINSREKIIDYMSHVQNNRLIQAGLPKDALFVHKTGDIGKMVGDAGIVYTPNGKRYIVVMLVNRPHNSSQAKDFIVKASSIIYAYMYADQNVEHM